VDQGDGTVADVTTGLMWQQTVPSNPVTQDEADAYCANLSLAGHTDWRLPTKIELMSIVDFGRTAPAINLTFFPNTPSKFFVSVSWNIFFQDGTTYISNPTDLYYVRCVR